MSEKTNMFSELHEIPKIVNDTTLNSSEEYVKIDKIISWKKNLILTWMGSSFFIAEIWKLYFQHIWNKNWIWVESADKLNISYPNLWDDTTIMAFSQSWNTLEVDEVLKNNNENWVKCFWVYNNPESKIESRVDDSYFLWVWKEKSPVSTKYIVAALTFLYRLSVESLEDSNQNKQKLNWDLEMLSSQLEDVLIWLDHKIADLVSNYKEGDHFVIVWNWIFTSVAKEISLKIRETVGVFSANENDWQLNHWWINSLSPQTIAILFNSSKSVLNSLQNRDAKVIHFWWIWSTIELPQNNDFLNPIISIVAAQLFIHHLSVAMWIDSDIKLW